MIRTPRRRGARGFTNFIFERRLDNSVSVMGVSSGLSATGGSGGGTTAGVAALSIADFSIEKAAIPIGGSGSADAGLPVVTSGAGGVSTTAGLPIAFIKRDCASVLPGLMRSTRCKHSSCLFGSSTAVLSVYHACSELGFCLIYSTNRRCALGSCLARM